MRILKIKEHFSESRSTLIRYIIFTWINLFGRSRHIFIFFSARKNEIELFRHIFVVKRAYESSIEKLKLS